jgi:hypothetical protein
MTGDIDLRRVHEVKAATLWMFEALWNGNYEANRPLIARSPGVSQLFGKFGDVPALIVGAGPSLEKNIHLLNNVQGRAAIIAVDTALLPLVSAGVSPTITVMLDPQPGVSRFFAGVNTSRKTLVAPSIASPKALSEWKGEIVFYNKFAPDIPALTRIASQSQELGYLIPGGSVLSVGLDLAFRMGAPSIGFAGQDLSYPPGGQAYVSGTAYGDMEASGVLESAEEEIVHEMDIFGRSLRTKRSLSVTKQWMEWAFVNLRRDSGKAEFYNLTEGGVVTRECGVISLAEWSGRFLREGFNLDWRVKKALQKKKR